VKVSRPLTTIDYAALARELAPLVAPLVVARFTAALGASAESPYSTRRGHEPPEFSGRPKAWRALASTIPGAVRLGRWVSVPRRAWVAWIESQSSPAPLVQRDPKPVNDSESWSPRRALEQAGLRPTSHGKERSA
jgi:hypothetical protein